jgi:hypothetical protein
MALATLCWSSIDATAPLSDLVVPEPDCRPMCLEPPLLPLDLECTGFFAPSVSRPRRED